MLVDFFPKRQTNLSTAFIIAAHIGFDLFLPRLKREKKKAW